MARANTVYIVQIHLKKRIEDSPDVISVVRKSILKSALDATDNPMTLSFVITDKGPAKSVLARYKAIADHPNVRLVRVLTTSPDYATSLPIQDKVCTNLDNAWRRFHEARETKNLAERNGLVVKKGKRASRKSRMNSGARRKTPQNFNNK